MTRRYVQAPEGQRYCSGCRVVHPEADFSRKYGNCDAWLREYDKRRNEQASNREFNRLVGWPAP